MALLEIVNDSREPTARTNAVDTDVPVVFDLIGQVLVRNVHNRLDTTLHLVLMKGREAARRELAAFQFNDLQVNRSSVSLGTYSSEMSGRRRTRPFKTTAASPGCSPMF